MKTNIKGRRVREKLENKGLDVDTNDMKTSCTQMWDVVLNESLGQSQFKMAEKKNKKKRKI